ncbi:MAG TPA: UDP-N-acetylenolpyruvoylglucosamine reductase [Desulfovibrio sp.]|jgi:UDP-N-acetylmuramate dehydrogenase|nr:UDP-N-acetylmuramate dehydrogenase [Desulfovibrio sp.]MDY5486732.1 UDP-N-acetylmuramate dehydrogenase [Desulfovibrio sp.]HAK23190.1 UDP-N-acetylenolpyruvoylglucosamine reductase [Desulfovibrio sp.]
MREVRNPSLSAITTLGLGGTCSLELTVSSRDDLAAMDDRIRELGLPVYVVGRGSNIFGLDGSHEAVLVRPAFTDGPAVLGDETADGGVLVSCGAGISLPVLLAFLREKGLSGMEGLAGIPGTVGGAVAMNAGSFGTSTAESLDSVEIWSGGRLVRLTPDACETGYRHFRPRGLAGSFLVVSAVFRLSRSTSQDVAAGMQHNFQMKKSRQPITARSAGCVFRNPACGVSAGALLERAGFRGRRKGSVALSEQHANFLVNLGGGTSSEALALLEEARTAVRAMAGVELDFEVRFLPCLSS